MLLADPLRGPHSLHSSGVAEPFAERRFQDAGPVLLLTTRLPRTRGTETRGASHVPVPQSPRKITRHPASESEL